MENEKLKDFIIKNFGRLPNDENYKSKQFWEKNVKIEASKDGYIVYITKQSEQNNLHYNHRIIAYKIKINGEKIESDCIGFIDFKPSIKKYQFFNLGHYINNIFVALIDINERYKGQGYGSKLLKIMEKQAINIFGINDKIKITGQFAPDVEKQKATQHFYEKNGYRVSFHRTTKPEITKILE